MWLPTVANLPTGRRRDSPISSSLFSHGPPCAQSVKRSPTEPVLSRSSRQRLGHLQSHVDGGWHVSQGVFPEPDESSDVTVHEKLFRNFNLLAAGR